jgi:N-formylglutamate amidohydrolase
MPIRFAHFHTPTPAPLLAVAIHHGHGLRSEVAEWMALDEATRLREEDPYTGEWARIADHHIVANYSRFEVDLNRPPEQAVYAAPADAWGLRVWKSDLPKAIVRRSRERHATFFRRLADALNQSVRRYGQVILLDLHSYNHRRAGPDRLPESPECNPAINIGTGTMDRSYWGAVVDRFIEDLRRQSIGESSLDVRENVRFRGGYLPLWVHRHYPRAVCAIAVEVKKFFMDEWTGVLDVGAFLAVRDALRSTLPGLAASREALSC